MLSPQAGNKIKNYHIILKIYVLKMLNKKNQHQKTNIKL